jgi:hypothetical protein
MTGDTNYACFVNGLSERTIYIRNTTGYSYLYTIGVNEINYFQSQVIMFVNPNLLIISEYRNNTSGYFSTIRVFNYSR